MNLVKNFVGFRLTMEPNQPYRKAQTIQVYTGIIGKIMHLLKLAFQQQFEDEAGRVITLAVNTRSVAHYIWRHNRCRDDQSQQYHKNMRSLYRTSHQYFHKNYRAHKSYTKEMNNLIGERALFTKKTIKIDHFRDSIQKQAPLIGNFYKIKKEDKTVGYLLGTIHIGNDLLVNLNPKINKALSKSKIVAGEQPINEIGQRNFVPRKDVEKKYQVLCKVLLRSMKKTGLNFKSGLEICLHDKIQKMENKPRLVGLETPEEKDDDLNLFLEVMDEKEKFVSKELATMYRDILSNNEAGLNAAIANLNRIKNYAESIKNRNQRMVDRADPFLQEDRTLIAVGNLHLPGEDGMINLLKAKGYTLTQN